MADSIVEISQKVDAKSAQTFAELSRKSNPRPIVVMINIKDQTVKSERR